MRNFLVTENVEVEMRHSPIAQYFHAMRRVVRRATSVCRDFSRDPLAHPALEIMSMTELADIPARELRAQGRV